MTIPTSKGITLDTRHDSDAVPWSRRELADALYELSASNDAESLLCEPMTLDGLEADFHTGMILDAVTTTYARLPRTIGAMARSLNKKLETGIEVTGTEMGSVKKSGIFASVAAIVRISDGQSVSVIFHAPDDDPKKIDQGDRLIAFRFLLNRSDITPHVAPSRAGTGFAMDLSLDQVITRIAQLVSTNSPKFQKKQKVIQDQKETLEATSQELEQTQAAIQEATQAMADANSVVEEAPEDERSLNIRLDRIVADNEKLERDIAKALERESSPAPDAAQADESVNSRIEDNGLPLGVLGSDDGKIKDMSLPELRAFAKDNFQVKLGRIKKDDAVTAVTNMMAISSLNESRLKDFVAHARTKKLKNGGELNAELVSTFRNFLEDTSASAYWDNAKEGDEKVSLELRFHANSVNAIREGSQQPRATIFLTKGQFFPTTDLITVQQDKFVYGDDTKKLVEDAISIINKYLPDNAPVEQDPRESEWTKKPSDFGSEYDYKQAVKAAYQNLNSSSGADRQLRRADDKGIIEIGYENGESVGDAIDAIDALKWPDDFKLGDSEPLASTDTGDDTQSRIEALRTMPIAEYNVALESLAAELEASGELEQYESQLEELDKSRDAEYVAWVTSQVGGA